MRERVKPFNSFPLFFSRSVDMPHYDDNFGEWDDMDDPDMQDFHDHVQRTNVETECSICGRLVMLQPHYDKCNSCMEAIERGAQY
jgi:hypothetical protein